MHHIERTLKGLSIASETTHRNLTMYALRNGGGCAPDYLTLSEALAAGTARVTEVSSGGSVPELLFENNGDRAVLLLDGEVLLGAKQNRTLNLTILAPAGKTTKIPVSCVERGRWSYRRPDFAASERMQFTEGRAKKAASVSRSMSETGIKCSDQGEVWSDIQAKMGRMHVDSPTCAMEDIYERHQGSVDDYNRAIRVQEGQVGAAFAINGRLTSLDLFDCPATLEKVLPKLVASCALDAIEQDRGIAAGNGKEALGEFLKAVASARFTIFPSAGEGEDVRFEDRALAGGALIARERVIHLCAFNMAAAGRQDGPGFARTSDRMRHRIL